MLFPKTPWHKQDNAIGSGDGTVEGRRYFVAKENFAKFLPLSDLTKVDNYAGRPRSGMCFLKLVPVLKQCSSDP